MVIWVEASGYRKLSTRKVGEPLRASNPSIQRVGACIVLAAQAALVCCAPEPSRAPLGGNYALPEVAESTKPKPPATAAPESASAEEEAPKVPAPSATASTSASASGTAPAPAVPSEDASTLHYEPLKSGDRIHIDTQLSLSARMEGMPSDFGGGSMKVDAKAKIDIKVVKATTKELEQLEVTFTPESMHSEFNGQGSDSAQEPPSVYDITASGSSPKISARSGTLEKEDRLTLLIFIGPLLEFQRRWGASPKFLPAAGYHASIPLSPPAFMVDASDATKIGPLVVRYDGPRTSDRIPFELALPLEVSGGFGKFNLELKGPAELGARARPLTLELEGPCKSSADSNNPLRISGEAKISAKLSYE